jgi:hypothetical protein
MNLGRAENYQSETLSGIYSAPGGCWRFWARRARISVDILGLGATSRQGGWFWGGVLKSSIRSKLRKQAAASGSG